MAESIVVIQLHDNGLGIHPCEQLSCAQTQAAAIDVLTVAYGFG